MHHPPSTPALGASRSRDAGHRPRPLLAALVAIAALAVAAPAQDLIPIARVGAAGHDIWIADAATGTAAPVLTGLTFAPVGLSGYPARLRLRSDLPAAVDGVGGAPHVRLPQGGALYVARLAGATALLQVAPQGTVGELLSVAEAGAASAFRRRLTVSPDGSRALVATTLAAGGDVLVVDLAGGAGARSLTAALPPLDVDDVSLRLASGAAWFTAGGRIYRAELHARPDAAPIPLDLPPGHELLPEIVAAADGSCVAVVTEERGGGRAVHTVDAAGVTTTVTPDPGAYDTPGYDSPIGPFLAVSPDGTHVAWRLSTASRELFVRRVAGPPPVHVTGDLTFIDTIDNVGVIGFVATTLLTFAAGEVEPFAPDTLDSADVYRMDVEVGAASLENVTQTSGVLTALFDAPGQLEILDAFEDPAGERLLLLADPDGGDAALLAVPIASGTGYETLAGPSQAVVRIGAIDDALLVVTHESGGGPASAVHAVHLVPTAGASPAAVLLGTTPPGVVVDRITGSSLSALGAFVVSFGADLDVPLFVDPVTGAVALAWDVPFGVSERLAFAPGGELVLGAGFTGGPFVFGGLVGPGSGFKLGVPVGDGFPLAP